MKHNSLSKMLLAAWLSVSFFASSSTQARQAELANAVEARDGDRVKQLLLTDIEISAAQADGMTALHWAVHYDDVELAKKLIDRSAKVDATNRYGVTPLWLACQNGGESVVAMLLGAGADPNKALPNGETSLMTACRTGKTGPVRALLQAGAEVNAQEHKKQTALMWAAAEGNVEVVDLLLQAGADRDVALRSGFTPLFFAVREGHASTVSRLLKAGCDVNAVMRTQSGVKFSRNRLSTTPLILAVENGHFELANLLLAEGADPNARPAGYSALHALTWVRKPIRGDGDPPPQGSGKLTSLDMVRRLMKAGADLNVRLENGKSELGRFTYTGSTSFLLAAQSSDLAMTKLLVELGADATIANDDGTTPLLAACGVGALGDGDESAGTEDEAIAMVEYLLSLGAGINAIDFNGETVMHGAAYQSWAKMASVLDEHGANIDIWNHENRAGWTAWTIAMGYRPGNFRPAPETIAAIESAMKRAGAQIPYLPNVGEHQRSWSTSRNENKPWLVKNLVYAKVDRTELLLDLHFPQRVAAAPIVVWVHGGAWRSGSKEDMPVDQLVKAGYVVASVNYRLSTEAQFPAQVHDIKAAIRYLRQIANRYGFQSERIAIAGSSAGGHLAALVGVSNKSAELEGKVGDCLDQSSEVHAIVDLFGPTNFMTILEQSTPHGLSVRKPAFDLLLGAQPNAVPALAKLASPVEHVDRSDPPLLLIHGDQDPQVPIKQSEELAEKYKLLGLSVEFEVIPGGEHGGKTFFDAQRQERMKAFLDTALLRN